MKYCRGYVLIRETSPCRRNVFSKTIHIFQDTAILERRPTNSLHTITDGEGGQSTAILERIIANSGHTVRNNNSGQTFTIIERAIIYLCYTITKG